MRGPPGLVLAGGASRRMGQDKALMPISGEAMAPRMARRLAEAGCTPVCLVGRQVGLHGLGWPVVEEDEAAPRHPLSGVASGLRWAAALGSPLALVVPCDLLFVEVEDLAALLYAGAATVAVAAGSTQPLVALLPTAWADRAGQLASAGASAHALVAGLPRLVLPDRVALNANRPEDLPVPPRSSQ